MGIRCIEVQIWSPEEKFADRQTLIYIPGILWYMTQSPCLHGVYIIVCVVERQKIKHMHCRSAGAKC